jgi:putative serine/threonine protein kinase
VVDLLCYPKFSANNYLAKIKDFFSLNLKFVLLEGATVLYNKNILGKGCEGLVLKVEDVKNEIMALKIKRTDSCRFGMKPEFEYYKLANSYGIGPRVHCCTNDFLLMEYIDGLSIENWFSNAKLDRYLIKSVVANILNQCFVLDKISLDHGQLNKLYNHINISPDGLNCTIIDFESASTSRKVSNLTSAFQGLFFKGIISKQINKFIDYGNKKNDLLKSLKDYKKNISKEKFDSLMALI